MKILAVDPGSDLSAWCVLVDGKPFEAETQSNFLVREKLRAWRAEGWLLAVEMIASYGMPVGREVFDTCVWIGRFLESWGGDHVLVYRKDVKMLLCGSMRAKDSNIRAALIDRFGGRQQAIGTSKAPGQLRGIKGDQWSALAVGITAGAASANEAQPLHPGVHERREPIAESEVPL